MEIVTPGPLQICRGSLIKIPVGHTEDAGAGYGDPAPRSKFTRRYTHCGEEARDRRLGAGGYAQLKVADSRYNCVYSLQRKQLEGNRSSDDGG